MFQRPHATMAYKVGYEEDSFLKSLAPLEPADIELRADNCSKVGISYGKNYIFIMLRIHWVRIYRYLKFVNEQSI